MGNAQVRELASHMNADKTECLPYLAQVYRTGTFRVVKDEKHSDAFESVVYTTATVKVNDREYKVEVVSKKRRTEKPSYIQYGISKADKAEDARTRSVYEITGVAGIEKPS